MEVHKINFHCVRAVAPQCLMKVLLAVKKENSRFFNLYVCRCYLVTAQRKQGGYNNRWKQKSCFLMWLKVTGKVDLKRYG